MKKIDLQQLSIFLSSRSDIIFAVSFGSSKDGLIEPENDFDIGIYFEPQPDIEALTDFLSQVADLIDFDFIDYTDLTKVDPILAFEAISGNFLCKNNPLKTAEYFSMVCREYEDLMGELRLPA